MRGTTSDGRRSGDVVVLEAGPDAGAVWHSGDPYGDQRAMLAGRGLLRLPQFRLIKVSGGDRLGWLHSLTTGPFEGLAPGQAITALILSPTGHIEHALHGVDDGTALWVWVESVGDADAVAWLDSMRFMMRVEVTDLTDTHQLVWLGSQDAAGLHPAIVRRPSDVADGVEAFVEIDHEFGDALEVGVWAWNALRIAAGVPRVGLDTDARTIPNEIGLYGTVLEKGCYRGQETVARVHNLGRPPRRLVLLHLDGSMDSLPASGAAVVLDGRDVGFVGSAERHHELGPIALALVKRNVATDATLEAGGIAASQDVLVDPEVGLHVRPKLGG